MLTPEILVQAYSSGIFPMPNPETGEIEWFCPNPRAILPLDHFHVSHSLNRSLTKLPYAVSVGCAFLDVMKGCANRKETWITEEFFAAYQALQRQGNANSIEIWLDGKLVGGVYGVCIGKAFFAESKFHTHTDCSKIALYHLVEWLKFNQYELLEVQFQTDHLQRLGVTEIPHSHYVKLLKAALF